MSVGIGGGANCSGSRCAASASAPACSPREIARDFETTAAYVRTIEHRAIRKLRSEGEKGSLDALHSYVERLDAVENSAEGLS